MVNDPPLSHFNNREVGVGDLVQQWNFDSVVFRTSEVVYFSYLSTNRRMGKILDKRARAS